MAKQSQVKSKRKILNPVFHVQTDKEDDKQLSQGMIKTIRRTGQMNLSGRGLASVPSRMFTMYDFQKEEALAYYDISQSPEDPWWSYKPLTYMDLSSNSLQTIPEDIKMFEDLTVINLHNNSLTEIPAAFGTFKKLTKLNLSHNKLVTLPKDFYSLTEIQQLVLSHNSLETLDDNFGDLIMLRQLDLSYNSLKALPAGIGFLVRLNDLNISHNQLTELPPDIVSLTVLQKLDVAHNNLKCIPSLHDQHKLQSLYAQHNDIVKLPNLEGCTSIQEVYLGNNYIEEITKEFCENLPHIKTLDLKDNKIKTLSDDIAMMQHLVRLDLSNNDLESLPNTLALISNLQNLQIDGNKLQQIRSDIVRGGTLRIMKHLFDKLNVKNHPASPDAVVASDSPRSKQMPDRYTMKHSRALQLTMRALTHVPNSVFEEAAAVEVGIVDLSKNKIVEVPLGLTAVANNITELNLSSNQIKEIPEFISECTKLLYINLGQNFIENLPDSIKSLRNVRELIIANNRFSKIPCGVYKLESLEILLAGDNHISGINVEGLMQLTRLAVLDLSNNNIKQIPPELGNMKQLRSLELKGNSFRTPRYAILEQGTGAVLSYLRDRIPQ